MPSSLFSYGSYPAFDTTVLTATSSVYLRLLLPSTSLKPGYVGLRVYLLNYREKSDDANRILGEYRYQLQTLAERKLGDGKYTALELIHKNYPYDDENVDFWLEKPKQMLTAIDSYETMLEQKDKDVYYIDVEDSEYE